MPTIRSSAVATQEPRTGSVLVGNSEPEASGNSTSSRKPMRPTTVLLIEDHPAVRQSTAAILQGAGYHVVEAHDGLEAMLHLSLEPIDVILLDVALPRMDGATLLEAQYHPPPVVVVSAMVYFSEEVLQAQFGSKIFAFLEKPVAPERLLAVVAEAVAGAPSH